MSVTAWVAKTGSCRRCLGLSVLLLAANLWILSTAVRAGHLGAIIFCGTTTGIFLGIAVANVVMFVWLKPLTQRDQGESPRLAEAPQRCCGR